VVTGGTGGLGRMVTPLLSQAGATIAVVDREPSSGVTPNQHFFAADVTQETGVARMLTTLVEKLGRLDVLINLVGGFVPGYVRDTAMTAGQKMIALNVSSALLLSRVVIPHMSAQRSGRIIHIAPGQRSTPFLARRPISCRKPLSCHWSGCWPSSAAGPA
jgi:NAD(P)-dependent dehydrogenase (short-subunit alcohol dehydrogenase family)